MALPPISSLLTVPRFVWAALFASQAIYAALFFVPGVIETRSADAAPPTELLLGLAVAALATAITSFALPAFLRRAALAQLSIATRKVPDPDALQGFRATPTIRQYVEPRAAAVKASQLAFVPLILSLAMAEAVSIMGLIAGVQGYPFAQCAPFFAVGMTLTAIRFPTERSFFGSFEAKTGITLPR